LDCFSDKLLPLSLESSTYNYSVNAIAFNMDYKLMVFGGQYGSSPFIGVFDENSPYRRVDWMVSYQNSANSFESVESLAW